MKYLFLTLSMLLAFGGAASAQKVTSRSAHANAHQNLLAKQQSASKNNVKLIESNAVRDLLEDIEPEIDIYTEGWNSKSVNPFKESQVPDRAVIDVRNYVMPVPGKLTSNYGYRAKFGRMHKGVDLALRSNDTVRAAFDGKVRLTNYEAKGYGNYVILRHPNGLETVYGHLNKALVKPNQTVKAGQAIGLGGSTGRSTGPHLHFETRYMGYAINPSAIFDFANKTTHTDTYTFTKTTYQQPRNFAPAKRDSGEKRYQAAASEPATYTVRQGDTLASIAKSYGVSTATLRRLNNMTDDQRISVGQTLKLK